MVEIIGQGGARRGHRLDRDEVAAFRMIDLHVRPGRSERKYERIMRFGECKAGDAFIRAQKEVIERTAGKCTIEILRTLKRQGTVIPSHGQTTIIEEDMLEVRHRQSGVRGVLAEQGEIGVPSEGDRNGRTAVGDDGGGDAESGLEEFVGDFQTVRVRIESHQIIMRRPVQGGAGGGVIRDHLRPLRESQQETMDGQTVAIPLHLGVVRPIRTQILSKTVGVGIEQWNATGLDITSEGIGTLGEMKPLSTLHLPGEAAEAAIRSDQDRSATGSVQMDVGHERTVHSSQPAGEKHPSQETPMTHGSDRSVAEERTRHILGRHRALIGMIHVPALPGTPRSASNLDEIITRVSEDAEILIKSGFDALIIENMHDLPYLKRDVGPEIIASMTVVATTLRQLTDRPLGIQILAGANRAALATALAADCQFIRAEGFAFSSVADEGLLETADAGPLLRYRKNIGAEGIAIFADACKKHSAHAITADITFDEHVETLEFMGADGAIVTGTATGKPVRTDDLKIASDSCSLPILVGSGVDHESVASLLNDADAVIVGSATKQHGDWRRPVDPEAAGRIVQAARTTHP